jgi:hypothetical protein
MLMASGTLDEIAASVEVREGVVLKLRKGGDEAATQLRRVPGVEKVGRSDKEYTVEWPKGRDPREDLVRLAVDKGWGLLEMRSLAMNIEDLYLKIVSGGTAQ